MAATARNIRLTVEMIITSHTGIAYHFDVTLNACRRTTFSVYWSVLSVRVQTLPVSVLYSVRCLEGIAF